MKQEKTFRVRPLRRFTAPLKDCIVLAPFLWKPYAVLMSLALLRSRCCSPGDQSVARAVTFKPTGFCPLSEYQRVDHTEMGDGVKRPGGVSLKLLSIVRKHGLEVLL